MRHCASQHQAGSEAEADRSWGPQHLPQDTHVSGLFRAPFAAWKHHRWLCSQSHACPLTCAPPLGASVPQHSQRGSGQRPGGPPGHLEVPQRVPQQQQHVGRADGRQEYCWRPQRHALRLRPAEGEALDEERSEGVLTGGEGGGEERVEM